MPSEFLKLIETHGESGVCPLLASAFGEKRASNFGSTDGPQVRAGAATVQTEACSAFNEPARALLQTASPRAAASSSIPLRISA